MAHKMYHFRRTLKTTNLGDSNGIFGTEILPMSLSSSLAVAQEFAEALLVQLTSTMISLLSNVTGVESAFSK